MHVFRCKSCGGSLEVTSGMTVCECEYCGVSQTFPRFDDEKRNQMFDRADYYRSNKEFDRAMAVYENILTEEPSEPEAHWGICLCRYGIEYVEDPQTHKRLPTCHRTQFKSILEDSDYLEALDNADSAAKNVYKADAEYIDRAQKKYLEIMSTEQPFDIFICYKETDSANERTIDSVIAQDIYNAFTDKGYKVFFSRITLEDKLGTTYEPYIFSALNTAKVMLVVGTKPEHFNAVWVKNEWSRFLSMIERGGKKVLIPCFRDMSPYDMPDEFSNLQSQDMSKIGCMQDLMRGVEKILKSSGEPKKPTKEIAGGDKIPPYLKRVAMFIDDNDWKSANNYCEKVLDIDPSNDKAHLYKLLIAARVKSIDDLGSSQVDIFPLVEMKNAKRFNSAEIGDKLDYAGKTIRLKKLLGELNGKPHSIDEFEEFERSFAELGDHDTAPQHAENCHRQVLSMKYKEAIRMMNLMDYEDQYHFMKAANIFNSISDYEDSEKLAKECEDKSEKLAEDCKRRFIDAEYKRHNGGKNELEEAKRLYSGLGMNYVPEENEFGGFVGVNSIKEAIEDCDRRLAQKENSRHNIGRILSIIFCYLMYPLMFLIETLYMYIVSEYYDNIEIGNESELPVWAFIAMVVLHCLWHYLHGRGFGDWFVKLMTVFNCCSFFITMLGVFMCCSIAETQYYLIPAVLVGGLVGMFVSYKIGENIHDKWY